MQTTKYRNLFRVLFIGTALMLLYYHFFGFEKLKVRAVTKEQVLHSRRIYSPLSAKVAVGVEYDLEGEADLFMTSEPSLKSKFPIMLRFTGKGDTIIVVSFSRGPVILHYVPITATKGEVTIRVR